MTDRAPSRSLVCRPWRRAWRRCVLSDLTFFVQHGAGRDRRDRAVAADGVRRPGIAGAGRVRRRRRPDRRGGHHALGAAAAGRPAAARPLVAAAFAAVVGIPLLRLQGHYLAFGTLALLLMVQTAMGTLRPARWRLRHQRHPGVRRRRLGRSSASGPTSTSPWAAWALVLLLTPRDRPTAASAAACGRWPAARPPPSPPECPVSGPRWRSSRCRRCTPDWPEAVGVLHALRQPGLLPGDPVVHLRHHGRRGRTRDDVGRGGRRGGRLGPAAGAQHGEQPARAAADGGPDHAVRDVRRAAGPGPAVHAPRHRPDRGWRVRPAARAHGRSGCAT